MSHRVRSTAVAAAFLRIALAAGFLSAVADPGEKESVSGDSGEPPRVINPSEGCRFRWRCPYAIERCAQVTPLLRPIGPVQVACHVAPVKPEDVTDPARAASIIK